MKKKTKEQLKILFIFVLIFISTSFLTKLYLNSIYADKIYSIREADATFKIGERLEFNTDVDKIDFGAAPYGGSTTKRLLLYHEYNNSLKVVVKSYGRISKVLDRVEPFYLEPKTEYNLTLVARAKYNVKSIYDGKISVALVKDD